LTIDGSQISGNQAHSGGGVYSAGDSNAIGLRSRVTITNTRISANDAEEVAGNIVEAEGGGLVSGGDAHVVLTDVTLANNTARDDGGGFANVGRTSLVATRLTVRDNETNGGGGGGYLDSERPALIRDSTFMRNDAGVQEPLLPGDIPPIG